jgi:hypothetical protein
MSRTFLILMAVMRAVQAQSATELQADFSRPAGVVRPLLEWTHQSEEIKD